MNTDVHERVDWSNKKEWHCKAIEIAEYSSRWAKNPLTFDNGD